MDRWLAATSRLGLQLQEQIASTAELARQRLGHADDKTQLPEEVLRLQKRVEALKQAHARMIKVTAHFANETYDYPSALGESISEMGRSVLDGLQTISHATNSEQVAAAFTGRNSNAPANPKTFAHALSRAAFAGSEAIKATDEGDYHAPDGADAFAKALYEYSVVCEKIGAARLAQDATIDHSAHGGWNNMSRISIDRAIDAGGKLKKASIQLDVMKSQAKGVIFNLKKNNKGGLHEDREEMLDEDDLTEEQRLRLAEEEGAFNAQVEDTTRTMKDVLAMSEPLWHLAELVKAQQQYHQTAADLLAELAPKIDELKHQQDAAERESRARN